VQDNLVEAVGDNNSSVVPHKKAQGVGDNNSNSVVPHKKAQEDGDPALVEAVTGVVALLLQAQSEVLTEVVADGDPNQVKAAVMDGNPVQDQVAPNWQPMVGNKEADQVAAADIAVVALRQLNNDPHLVEMDGVNRYKNKQSIRNIIIVSS